MQSILSDSELKSIPMEEHNYNAYIYNVVNLIVVKIVQ